MQTQKKNVNTSNLPELTLPENFIYHEDAGHGWLAVPRAALKLLKVEEQITSYSYQKEEMVYLEEDQDLFTFAKAYLAYFGKTTSEFASFPYTCQNDGDWSPIREYDGYKLE